MDERIGLFIVEVYRYLRSRIDDHIHHVITTSQGWHSLQNPCDPTYNCILIVPDNKFVANARG